MPSNALHRLAAAVGRATLTDTAARAEDAVHVETSRSRRPGGTRPLTPLADQQVLRDAAAQELRNNGYAVTEAHVHRDGDTTFRVRPRRRR